MINVREIEQRDIKYITDYWTQSNDDYFTAIGVDLAKLPTRAALVQMLETQIEADLKNKMSYALIWEIDGQQVGHSNITDIDFGNSAKMHLHLWQIDNRKRGFGADFVKKSLPFYFNNFQLKEVISEPYALNPAPNKTFQKTGFELVKTYKTIPSSLNFEQEVNQWRIAKEQYESL